MSKFVVTVSNGFFEHGAFVEANSKDEAVEIFKTAPQFRIFKGEEIVSVDTASECGLGED